MVLGILGGALLAAAPAAAEDLKLYEGEPTDPEALLVLIEDQQMALPDYGMSDEEPTDIAARESWVDALLALLGSLGLLPSGETAP